MTHKKAVTLLAFNLLLITFIAPSCAMESQEPAEQDKVLTTEEWAAKYNAELVASKKRFEDVQRRAEEYLQKEAETKRQQRTEKLKQEMAIASQKLDTTVDRHNAIMVESDALLKQAEDFLRTQKELKDHGNLTPLQTTESPEPNARFIEDTFAPFHHEDVVSASYSPILAERTQGNNNNNASQSLACPIDTTELEQTLDEYFRMEEQNHNFLNVPSAIEQAAAVPLLEPSQEEDEFFASSAIAVQPVAAQEPRPVAANPGFLDQLALPGAPEPDDRGLINDLGAITAEEEQNRVIAQQRAEPIPAIAIPVIAEPIAPAQKPAPIQHPNPHHFEESTLAAILNNIMEHKAPMITAGTLGLVHYLYENEIFNDAVAVRSPKMCEVMHDYLLPTAREALAAHLIQLILPYLPYLRNKGIRSYSTPNYLASFVTTKVLGTTALYLAKMVTETEHGKRLITQYKRLPRKTKETIEKVMPWLDFTRNLFMARSLANYFEPARAA